MEAALATEPGDTSSSVYWGKLNHITLHICAQRNILILSVYREERNPTISLFLRKLRGKMKFWVSKSRKIMQDSSNKYWDTPPPLASHMQNYHTGNTTTKPNNLPFHPCSGCHRVAEPDQSEEKLEVCSYCPAKTGFWRWGKSRPNTDPPTDKTRAQLMEPCLQQSFCLALPWQYSLWQRRHSKQGCRKGCFWC